jgi:hypothetical protein
MNFTSQICTTEEQSKRLLTLGLKAETADMRYRINYFDLDGILLECIHSLELGPILNNDSFIPAWSFHRLKCLLPEKVPYGNGYLTVEIINENIYIVLVVEDVEQRVLKYTKGNLYDNLISCINFFVKENIFNKEYLE